MKVILNLIELLLHVVKFKQQVTKNKITNGLYGISRYTVYETKQGCCRSNICSLVYNAAEKKQSFLRVTIGSICKSPSKSKRNYSAAAI